MLNRPERVSDKHPELFHYTTVDAFENIYNSRTFWATHYEDLNDSSELRRFRLKVRDLVARVVRDIFEERTRFNDQFADEVKGKGGIDAVVNREAEMHSDQLHRATFGEKGLPDVFVCSFCTHCAQSYQAKHELLSQWRGCGADGGIAIVLDTHGIEEKMKHEKDVFSHPINHIGDVIYDDDSGLENKVEFSRIFELLPEIIHAFYSGRQPRDEEIFDPFMIGSTLVKHRGFSEEKEVRIVVSPTPACRASIFYSNGHDSKPIKLRKRGDGEHRYIELFGDASLPIRRVIMGPSRIQDSNYQKVREWTAGSAIKVDRSETPLVG